MNEAIVTDSPLRVLRFNLFTFLIVLSLTYCVLLFYYYIILSESFITDASCVIKYRCYSGHFDNTYRLSARRANRYVLAKGRSDRVRDPLTPRNSLQ